MATNNRIFYAVAAVGVAECGSNTFTEAHGVQSVSINTRFNLEQIFELGQVEIYENIEGVPDVELTIEKVLDGAPLLYHLATPAATASSLVGRSQSRATVGLSIYLDTQDSASGTPLSQMTASGVYISGLTYNFPVQGSCTEQVTLVGNNKVWTTGNPVAFTFTPDFDNTDSPPGTGGVQQRENVKMGLGASLWPTEIPGITSTGTNVLDANGQYGAHIQNTRVTTNLGREGLFELGRRTPYFRYANFPVEVQTSIEITATRGDNVNALEEATNLSNQTIRIWTDEGTKIDLGTKNKLTSVSYTGGNAGQNGGNVTCTYEYVGYTCQVVHPEDPAGL